MVFEQRKEWWHKTTKKIGLKSSYEKIEDGPEGTGGMLWMRQWCLEI